MEKIQWLIQWLIVNDKWVTICISFLSLVISSILTYLIIKQTHKLNKQQMQIEENINFKQLEMQKRQICIDSYPYKREIYCYVFAVLELCHQLQELYKTINFHSKDPVQLLEIFKSLQEQYVPDTKKALWSMREAEYVLPKNISLSVIDIRKNYDSMCVHFTIPASVAKALTPSEIKTHMDEIKRDNINKAIVCCNKIIEHTSFIESIMPRELDISELSK